MKMGIGADFPKGRQVDYVLEPFAQAEEEQMPKVLEAAAEAVRSFAFKGIAQTMTDFNKSWL
jgi:PTH1 family peptidyl-tRNA hydrolase